MLTIIDNYDSFTYNLVHYFGDLGIETQVYRNDEKSAAWVLAQNPKAIVMSPGPCTPNEAGICLDLIAKSAGKIPLLGVCLGHQAIGQAFRGKVVRAAVQMHGKLSQIRHDGSGVFAGIDGDFPATRYHSLVVDRASLPRNLLVNAETADGVIMGLRHAHLPVHGVQFHPESIASANRPRLLKNFLDLATAWNAQNRRLRAAG